MKQIIMINNKNDTIHYYTTEQFYKTFCYEIRQVSDHIGTGDYDISIILTKWNGVFTKNDQRPLFEYVDMQDILPTYSINNPTQHLNYWLPHNAVAV